VIANIALDVMKDLILKKGILAVSCLSYLVIIDDFPRLPGAYQYIMYIAVTLNSVMDIGVASGI